MSETPSTLASDAIGESQGHCQAYPVADKIVFLDIDGVLIPYGQDSRKLYRPAAEAFQHLLNATDAMIVISSSWRIGDMHRLWALFEAEGWDLRIIGWTPWSLDLMETNGLSRCRPKEIQAWLDDYAYQGRYLVIDDEVSVMKFPSVIPQHTRGLTMADANHGIEILNAD